jgi:hypothetical protein
VTFLRSRVALVVALSIAVAGGASFGVVRAAERQLTKGQARAVAAEINLRPTDLPGFSAQPDSPGSSSSLPTCYGGVTDSQALADVYSPSSSRPVRRRC